MNSGTWLVSNRILTIRHSNKPSRTTESKENRIQKVIVAVTISLGICNSALTSEKQYTFSRELLHGLIDLKPYFAWGWSLSTAWNSLPPVLCQRAILIWPIAVHPFQLLSTSAIGCRMLHWESLAHCFTVRDCTSQGWVHWCHLFKVWLYAITSSISLCVWQGFHPVPRP